MHRVLGLGLTMTLVGLAGYLLGLTTAYPGRSFSVTLLMTGIALVAMWRAFDATAVDG